VGDSNISAKYRFCAQAVLPPANTKVGKSRRSSVCR